MTMNQNHFATGGDAYARHRPVYPLKLAQALAQRCANTDHALDVGCGNGQLSALLARCFDRVTATDPSRSQLESATRAPNITYICEPAEEIGSPDASIDLIVAAQAAHWFDLDRFYGQARRVARPGALLALVSYGVPRVEGPAHDAFHRFYWGPIHDHWPHQRRHVDEGYASLGFPFPEQTLPELTIECDWALEDLTGYINTWSVAKRVKESGAEHVLGEGLRQIRQAWGPAQNIHRVVFPIVGRLGVISGPEPGPTR